MQRLLLVPAVGVILLLCSSLQASLAAPAKALATLSYRPDGKLISLPVTVNGTSQAWFTLDSGARHTVVDPRLARALGLKTKATTRMRGTGAGDVPVTTLSAITLSFGQVKFAVDEPWMIDLKDVPIKKDIRGLVGEDLLARYVVAIDPERHTLALYDPDAEIPFRQYCVPLIAKDGRLFVDATLRVRPDLTVTHRLRVDTGSEDSVNDPIVGEARLTHKTVVGNGLGKNFTAPSGVYESVTLGPYSWRRVWGPGAPGPAIGMELLRRFFLLFDVPHGRLCLTPNAQLNAAVPPPN
jgi:hypothetical protein